jgi:U3 small nucleolar RNA-associated protein 7
VNPYQTKKQRREAEVKALLEKIPSDLISLNQNQIAEIDVDSLEEKMAERNKKLSLKPAQIDFEPRSKSKGKSGTAKKFHIKRTVKEEEMRRRIKELAAGKNLEEREGKKKKEKEKPKNILSRLT